MSRIAIAAVAVLLLSSAVTPGIAAGVDPRFEAHVGQSVVPPGQSTDLAVTLENDAEDADDRADIAHNVEATLESGGTPFTVNSGTRVLGTIRDGQPVQTTFAISVPQDIDPGTYHLPVSVTYEYDGDERETETVAVTVKVPDRAMFEVVETESRVPVGGDGPVTVTIENVGTEPATDASVELASKTKAVHFDGSPTAARYVGSWDPGEQRTVSFTTTARPSAQPGAYPLSGTVAFDDADGNRRHSAPLPISLTADRQRFELSSVDSTLQVAGDGVASIDVQNAGSAAVDGVFLEMTKTGPHIQPSQVTYPLGHLDAGERMTARVPITVSKAAEPGPREIATQVTYADADGDRVRGDTHSLVVDVAPRQSFDASVVENTLRVDREGDLTLRIENTGTQPMRNANVRIAGTAPSIHPEQQEFAVGQLNPGESTTVTYSIDVAEGATPTPRTMEFVVAYDDPDGDRRTTRPQVRRVDIAPDRPVFEMTVEDGAISAGDAGSVTISLTNTGNETLRGLDAKAFTDAPIDVTDDSAFVAQLGPGETTTVQFGVAIPGDAQVKDYPLSIDVQYQDGDGETKLTDTYDIPVTVTRAPGVVEKLTALAMALSPQRDLFVGGVAGLGVSGLALGTVGLWRRRRDDE